MYEVMSGNHSQTGSPPGAEKAEDGGDFAKCQRSQQRRNTDFSQADNDLKRFLSEREQKRRDSDQDIMPSPTYITAETCKKDIFPTRVFGSVEKLDDIVSNSGGEVPQHPRCGSLGAKDVDKLRGAIRRAHLSAHIKNRRFRIESSDSSFDRQESVDVASTPVLENPEHQTLWYSKYFLGKFHHNYVGQDSDKNTYVLSVVEERSFGKAHCRCNLWTKDGPKRLVVQGPLKSRSAKTILGQFGCCFEQPPKEVSQAGLQKDLFTLEKQERAMNLKFGVIYAKGGQMTDDEYFSNEEGSEAFERFLHLLGERITLKGWDRYRGGLDTHNDMTGTHAIYTLFEDHQVIFHVSTLLPYSHEDSQQVERKRHIGNDIVNIVFMDGSVEEASKFQPQFIKSQFTHIYAVVCYVAETDCYHVSVLSDETVPVFGPLLTNLTKFTNHQEFRRFLLIKLINGEKATYKANVFSSKRERTYEMLLQDMYDQYGSVNADRDSVGGGRANSGSIKLYGNQRKLQDQMDSFVKMGQALRLESKLTGGGCGAHRSIGQRAKSPWEPLCIYPNFPHRVLCGDSWGTSGLVLGTPDGTFLVALPTKQPTLILDKSVGIVVQLNIIEAYGIMVMRALRHRGDGGKLIVMRLCDLEEYLHDLISWHQRVDSLLHDTKDTRQNIHENLVEPRCSSLDSNSHEKQHWEQRPHWEPRTKTDMRPDVIEASKGCTLFTVSRQGVSPLRLAYVVGRRAVLMRWRHQEEWISLTTDTAEGFELEAEVTLHETPTLLTLLGGINLTPSSGTPAESPEESGCGGGLFSLGSPPPASPPKSAANTVKLLVGSRHHFDLVRIGTGATGTSDTTRILSMASGSSTGAISATEIFYDQESEVLLSHNCSSHVQKSEAGAARTHPIEWNSVPLNVVCAFPYILAFSMDAIEFRYAVNGSLLQTLCMPELKLISAKDDLYLCSTKQPVATRKPLDGGYQDLDYRYLYKIPWPQLVGSNPSNQPKPQRGNATNQSVKHS